MRDRLLLTGALSLLAVPAVMTICLTFERDMGQLTRKNQAMARKLEESRQRRDAFRLIDKELADAVAAGRLSLEQGAQELADFCTTKHPTHLKAIELELNEALPARQLALVSLLRSIRYYREAGAYPSLSRELGELLDALPPQVWYQRDAPNPWLAFLRKALN